MMKSMSRLFFVMLALVLFIAPVAAQDDVLEPTEIPDQGVIEWDYVVLGDSLSFGYPRLFAEMLEADLGVTINLHNEAIGADPSNYLLYRLRTDEQLRTLIREAEVITIEIGMDRIRQPSWTFVSGGDCGGEDNQDCLRESYGAYMADVDAIFAEIVALRSPSEALIRAMDIYQFYVARTKESGSFATINRYWREANAHLIEIAEAYNIPAARVYDAFMGEGGIEDPQSSGLVGSDELHPTQEGIILIAELFHNLGYDYAPLAEAPVSTPTPMTYYITVGTANVRECPGTDCARVTTFSYGDAIDVIGTVEGENTLGSSQWREVQYQAQVVYVHSALMSLSAPPPAVSITIPGDVDWVDSGIWVNAGDTFTISASGEVNPCVNHPEVAVCYPHSPAGLTEAGTVVQSDPERAGSYPLPGGTMAALVGRIGQEQPFEVGAGGRFRATSDGMLQFRINDEPLNNNRGTFTLRVIVYP